MSCGLQHLHSVVKGRVNDREKGGARQGSSPSKRIESVQISEKGNVPSGSDWWLRIKSRQMTNLIDRGNTEAHCTAFIDASPFHHRLFMNTWYFFISTETGAVQT